MTLLLPERTGLVPELTIGDRLRIARKQSGMDTALFAAQIGLSRVTVSKYENDKVQPHLNNLRVWAEATGVDLHWIEVGHAKTPADSSTGVCDLCALTGSNRGPADYGSAHGGIVEFSVPDYVPGWMLVEAVNAR